jgi:hypothetical protein
MLVKIYNDFVATAFDFFVMKLLCDRLHRHTFCKFHYSRCGDACDRLGRFLCGLLRVCKRLCSTGVVRRLGMSLMIRVERLDDVLLHVFRGRIEDRCIVGKILVRTEDLSDKRFGWLRCLIERLHRCFRYCPNGLSRADPHAARRYRAAGGC